MDVKKLEHPAVIHGRMSTVIEELRDTAYTVYRRQAFERLEQLHKELLESLAWYLKNIPEEEL